MSLTLPQFDLKLDTIEPELTRRLAENHARIHTIIAETNGNWEHSILPLDALSDALNQFWSPVQHLNAVCNSDELRAVYNACLPKLSDYATELGQNPALMRLYENLQNSPEFKHYSPARRKVLANALRDFRLSGIALPDDKKVRYKAIAARLSELTTQFEEHLLDATKAWSKLITDEMLLEGIPTARKAAMAESATQRKLSGWLVTLDYPCFHDVITYADNRSLREEIYQAYCTRASDQGPNAGQFDNSAIMAEILVLRQERAQLLGYENYAELSLVPKMAQTPGEVLAFLEDLVAQVKPLAQEDLNVLRAFAQTKAGADFSLAPWDMAYYSEQLREQNYAVSDELVRPYFPVTQVINGLFEILQRLYGLTLVQRKASTWHADVRFYEIYNDQQELIGGVYFDLYARTTKRSGAWMDEAIARYKTAQGIQLPVAYLNCNFSAPTLDQPVLLTHNEVETLFHEFGHCLQHLLTQIDELGVSGLSGVPWDAVEFPSQFFEAWCWQPEGLRLLSSHYQTGEPLPDELIHKLIAAKNFQAALFLIRQLEFAVFDMTLHLQAGKSVQDVLQAVRAKVAVMKTPDYNRFAHSFSHVFAGGYAAGYYSYLWAEVLARDAFSAFLQQGIFNRQLGEKFKNTVLAQGGSVDPKELFTQFMGRAPDNAALLAYYGLMFKKSV